MEIRDPIHGSIAIDSRFIQVIDSREYQRLRQIKQLGFSEFSFPGATHNRYLHSIGVYHLAGQAFDSIFKDHRFSKALSKGHLKSCFQLAALLHDIGHGPLSHTTEEVMPMLGELQIASYEFLNEPERQANHEDYTIKFICESPLTETLKQAFVGHDPIHVACLIDSRLPCPDDFFVDGGLDFRPILSQLVSSELDVDRLDYLMRDSYFCGTSYGKVELGWLLANLTYHVQEARVYLAVNHRALYTFDDFLISRHHMHLMVYFHHKSVIYEEMLGRYLRSRDCSYKLPGDIEKYTYCTDFSLFEHLSHSENTWARRISARQPFKVLVELHSLEASLRPKEILHQLQQEGFDAIYTSSQTRLSKYHQLSNQDKAYEIFVVDQYNRWDRPVPIAECTEIFKAYEHTRVIDRIYIAPENYDLAESLIAEKRLF